MLTFWVSSDLLNIIIANPPKMRTPEMSDEIATRTGVRCS
jgi:hypothetical protein